MYMYRYSARVSICILHVHVYIEVGTCVHMFTYWEPVYIMTFFYRKAFMYM